MRSKGDEQIEGDVKAALAASPDVNAMNVRVHSEQGHVRLVGVVDAVDERVAACEIALRVPGVKGVENHLVVAADGEVSDLELQREEGRRLAEEGLEEVGVRVNAGTAFLEGVVPSLSVEKRAVDVAGSVQGVREVVSDLEVAAGRPVDDVGLANDVAEALSDDARLGILHLEVHSRDGVVCIYGEVPTDYVKSVTTEVAESVPGVKKVENHLKLRKPAF